MSIDKNSDLIKNISEDIKKSLYLGNNYFIYRKYIVHDFLLYQKKILELIEDESKVKKINNFIHSLNI